MYKQLVFSCSDLRRKKKEVESELLYQFLSIVSNFALKWYKRKRMMIHLKKYVAYSNNWYFLAQIFEDKKIDNEFVVCYETSNHDEPLFLHGVTFRCLGFLFEASDGTGK